MFSNDDVAGFFDRKWSVITEKDILTPDGNSFIPDRLIIEENNIKIIDFKTGRKSYYEKHAEQILRYKKLLAEMSIYDNIEAYLLYTDLAETVKVI